MIPDADVPAGESTLPGMTVEDRQRRGDETGLDAEGAGGEFAVEEIEGYLPTFELLRGPLNSLVSSTWGRGGLIWLCHALGSIEIARDRSFAALTVWTALRERRGFLEFLQLYGRLPQP